MENQTSKPNSSDEIDLTQFFRWIGRGFSNLGNSIIYGMAVMRNVFFQNRLFFLGIIIVGLILGAMYSELLKKKFYKSTMVLSCDYLNTQILRNTIDKFNQLSSEKGAEGLQEVLDLDESTAKNIQQFDFRSFVSEDDVVEMEVLREQLNNVTAEKKELVDKVIDRLEIENKNAYEISVLVYDPGIVRSLETALVNYFNNNNYIKRRIEINRANLLEKRKKLEGETRKLDSLKILLFHHYSALADKTRGSNNVIMSDETLNTPMEVFTKDLEIYEDLQEVKEQVYLKPDFEIVDGFTTFKEPESASLTEILISAFFISLLVGYLILGAIRFDRVLATYPTKTSVSNR
jgi:hypothetical protein